MYGILELISTRAMAGVTDDCQNSTISHAVMPSPFKSPYSYTARSSAAPVRFVLFRATSRTASYRFASVSLYCFKSWPSK